MKNLTEVEANAVLLLSELEYAIISGASIPANVINQMSILKQRVLEANEQLAKDLEIMYSLSNKVF
jgi:hypothetical protein